MRLSNITDEATAKPSCFFVRFAWKASKAKPSNALAHKMISITFGVRGQNGSLAVEGARVEMVSMEVRAAVAGVTLFGEKLQEA
jgi:hypothetical protein